MLTRDIEDVAALQSRHPGRSRRVEAPAQRSFVGDELGGIRHLVAVQHHQRVRRFRISDRFYLQEVVSLMEQTRS